ncbi:hypothetical protein B7P43_G14273 [Cryptotermes secundus]|uniref:Helix-turn-helix domain-containing protein n=1 Tax=Cryptotermes secundus TaxID=105785 RepID=A0A2J7RPB4_9NEOP|nr:hypothetical protein B7P43_G14273 [Cryptotermes secundus]
MEMEIYRKPTTCHPKEQKLPAYKNWIHRLLTLPLEENAKIKELNTIINITLNNGYRKEDITHLYNKLKRKMGNRDNKDEKEQNGSLLLIQEITYEKSQNYSKTLT